MRVRRTVAVAAFANSSGQNSLYLSVPENQVPGVPVC